MGGIEHVARGVIADLEAKFPRQRKTQRGKLGLLVASMLEVRSANLMDLAASLPRPCALVSQRSQWIERFLANPLVDVDAVMAPYGREVLARLARHGARVVVMIDQSKASDRHQMVMVFSACRRSGVAAGVAGQGNARRDRLCRAARSARSGAGDAA